MHILLNPRAARAASAQRSLRAAGLTYTIIKSQKHLASLVREGDEFVICGGDGTISAYLQEYMRLPATRRKGITIGIIPCGRANDLARELGIPKNPKAAIAHIMQQRRARRRMQIDLIKVNDRFLATGGGIGLPAEVVIDVNRITRRHPRGTRAIKELIYLLFATWHALFRNKGVELHYDKRRLRALAAAIQNQSTIGKRFVLAPDASNTDGAFDICIIDAQTPVRSLLAVMRGERAERATYARRETAVITTQEDCACMGDGEILCRAKKFRISICKGALFIY